MAAAAQQGIREVLTKGKTTVPVSVATANDPFRGQATRPVPGLRVPQARVLAALMPTDPSDPPSEWPLLTRVALAARAGYTAISGSVTRALNGIHTGSSSGDPHPGLVERGLVEVLTVDVEGLVETNYRATLAGLHNFQAYLAVGNRLPEVRNAALCTNDRYRKETK